RNMQKRHGLNLRSFATMNSVDAVSRRGPSAADTFQKAEDLRVESLHVRDRRGMPAFGTEPELRARYLGGQELRARIGDQHVVTGRSHKSRHLDVAQPVRSIECKERTNPALE